MMKKIVTLLLLTLCLQTTKAQMVTIPDANFAAWLQANVPSAMTGNQMDTTSLAVTTRTIISVEDLGIADLTGIQYFDSLKTLDCGNGFVISPTRNTLTSLPPTLPATLDSLICGRNLLTTLPILPNTLKLLKCYSNQLTILPTLPNTLIYLDCSTNSLTTIPVLPTSLKDFYCGANLLTSIPALPNFLINFACNANNLSLGLPVLPNSIQTINCESCQLLSLPALPNNLRTLMCAINQLTTLPILPNTLEELYCHVNQLTTLPPFPPLLNDILCFDNQLTSLPPLNCPLWALWCWNNQLTSLPVLPATLLDLKCANNQINCFPPFDHSYSDIDISGNPFTCLPNYNWAMNAATLNYPLCVPGNTVTNPNNCPDATGIVGFTYKDNNTTCLKDAGDLGLKNIPIQLYDNTGNFLSQTYTALNGVYQFLQNSNTYTVSIDTTALPFMPSCMYPGLDTTVTVAILDTNINFALTCKPGFDVGIQSIVTNGIIFPGQTHELNVNAGDVTHWYNLNCASGVSGTVSFSVNGPVTYIGPAAGALTPNVVGNVYTYTIVDFGTVNNTNDFSLQFQTNTTVQAGDIICVNATVTPISGDQNPTNNTNTFCYAVINSHDPNIKEVYPVTVAPNFSDWLTYTIHFQNTGNAPAINIRLEDQLDTKLDPETFQIINYSHNNVIDLTGNHLTVRFPNIQLVDSTTNPTSSIGFIQYRIKPKTGWITDTIKNSANIYFDYNAPVVTNTAKTYFMTTTAFNSLQNDLTFTLYPNPTNSILNITDDNNQLQNSTIEIKNTLGQTVLSKPFSSQVDISNLSSGIYFLTIQNKEIKKTVKVVKD